MKKNCNNFFLMDESLLYLWVKFFCCSINGLVIRNYWNFFFGLPTLRPQLPMKWQNDATCRPSRKLDKNWIFCRSKVITSHRLNFFLRTFGKVPGESFLIIPIYSMDLVSPKKKLKKLNPRAKWKIWQKLNIQ